MHEKKQDDTLTNINFDIERGEFVETFFKKGAEFTSQLLNELKKLQSHAQRLKKENSELRHHLASEEAIRELLEKIDKLEKEKQQLSQHVEGESKKNDDYAEKYSEVERELDMMANLYVALSQLHSKFEPKEMLGVIEQLLAQFIGVGSFIIYLRRDGGGSQVLEPVHAYHCRNVGGIVAWNDGAVGEAAATQMNFVADLEDRDETVPIACIPMVLGDETIGVISILDFFEQKTQFEEIDFEFFKLLATHSASAIVAAGLMADADSMGTGLRQYERL